MGAPGGRGGRGGMLRNKCAARAAAPMMFAEKASSSKQMSNSHRDMMESLKEKISMRKAILRPEEDEEEDDSEGEAKFESLEKEERKNSKQN